MDYGHALLAFSGLALLLTITPGLDMALVLRSALTQGRVHAAVTGLSLAGVHVGLALLFFAVLITAAHAFRRVLSGPRAAAWIDRLTGTALLVFGVVLLLEGSH